MENASLVSKSLLSSTELLEVISSLGDDIPIKTHFNSSNVLSSNGHVKEYGICDFSIGLSSPEEAREEISNHWKLSGSGSTCSHGMLGGGSECRDVENAHEEKGDGEDGFHVALFCAMCLLASY